MDARDRAEIDATVRQFGELLEALRGGRISGRVTATAAPTGGAWSIGDFVRNSAPAEAGGGGSKYVILGWVCVASGTPGTWLESRVLTGN